MYDRFAALVPPPPGVTREGIRRLDQSMLDLWWNSLTIGDIYLWRYWEQSTSPHPDPSNQLVLKKQLLLEKKPDAQPSK